jgi:hypothetical protein
MVVIRRFENVENFCTSDNEYNSEVRPHLCARVVLSVSPSDSSYLSCAAVNSFHALDRETTVIGNLWYKPGTSGRTQSGWRMPYLYSNRVSLK